MASTDLTPLQRVTAHFDALGLPVRGICEAAGVSQSAVSKWRSVPEYIAERERRQDLALAKLEPRLNAIRLQSLEAVEAALAESVETLAATDDSGNPAYFVRLKAAEVIDKLARTVLGSGEKVESGPAIATAVTKVEIVTRDDGSRTANVIEGHVVREEIEGADRREDRDADGDAGADPDGDAGDGAGAGRGGGD